MDNLSKLAAIVGLGFLAGGCTQTYVYSGVQPTTTYYATTPAYTYVQPVYVQPAPVVVYRPNPVVVYNSTPYYYRGYGYGCRRGYYGRAYC